MRFSINVTLFILIYMTFMSCMMFDSRLEVHNMTSNSIVVEGFEDTIPDLNKTFFTRYYLLNIINKGERLNVSREEGVNSWPRLIKRSKNNKLNLFIFQVDSIKKYHEIDSLILKKIYTRYEFTNEELEKNGWKVEIK